MWSCLNKIYASPEAFETHMPSLEASTIAWTWAIDENPGRVVVISERNRFVADSLCAVCGPIHQRPYQLSVEVN
jgi:hypothetical protein